MRKLRGTDLFKMLPIIKKTGTIKVVKEIIKGTQGEEILKSFNDKGAKEGESQDSNFEQIGMLMMADIADAVVEGLADAEKEINAFLADLTGQPRTVIEELEMADYAALVFSFFQKEELKGFLPQFKQLIK